MRYPRLNNTALAALILGAATVLVAPAVQAESGDVRHYQIAPGDLGQVLNRYAGEAGITVVVNSSLTDGKASLGLSGDYSAEGGLHALLAGTGLQLVRQANGSYTLEPVPAPHRDGSRVSLGPLKVTSASGFEQVITDAPASISVITREELEKRPVTDFVDIIREIPGASITNGEGRNVDISLRGMPPGYTLLLVDGKRQNLSGLARNGNNNLRQSFLPPSSAIERIEVIRGPMSTLYGSDAMGGVINVITKKASREWNGEFSADYVAQDENKFGNSRGVSAYVNGPIISDKVGIQISAREQNRDEDQVPRGKPARVNQNVTMSLWAKPTDNQDLEFERSDEYFEMDSWITGRTPGQHWTQTGTRETWSVSHEGRWDFGTSEVVYQKEDVAKGNVEGDNWTLNAKLLTPWSMAGDHLTTMGVQATSNKVNSWNLQAVGGGIIDVIEQKNQAVFAEDEWTFLPDLTATLGLRLDDPEDFSSHASPRGYLVWRTTENLTLKGGIATGFQAPRADYVMPGLITESTSSSTGVVSYTYANPNLKPETSTNYEVSAIWQGNQGLNVALTLFHTRYQDKLSSNSYEVFDDNGAASTGPMDPDSLCAAHAGANGCTWSERVNIDEAESEGVELTLEMPLRDDLHLNASYTYLESEQKTGANKGSPLSGSPRNKLVAGLDWQLNDRVNLWSSYSYRTRLRASNRPAPGCFSTKSCPSLGLLDLGATIRVDDRLRLDLGLYNAAGTAHWDYDTEGSVEEQRRYFIRATYGF